MCPNCGAERTDKRIFCPSCGRAFSTAELRSLRFTGFAGKASLSPRMERWHATGDPDYTAPESEIPTAVLDRRNANLLSAP